MSSYYIIGENFVDYALCKDLKKAHKAGVFKDFGDDSEQEDRYVSELNRRMNALDSKSVYIALKAFIKNHRNTVVRTLEYLEKEREGEKNNA